MLPITLHIDRDSHCRHQQCSILLISWTQLLSLSRAWIELTHLQLLHAILLLRCPFRILPFSVPSCRNLQLILWKSLIFIRKYALKKNWVILNILYHSFRGKINVERWKRRSEKTKVCFKVECFIVCVPLVVEISREKEKNCKIIDERNHKMEEDFFDIQNESSKACTLFFSFRGRVIGLVVFIFVHFLVDLHLFLQLLL